MLLLLAVSVMSCAWCLIFWILDFTTGDWYINILYVHCFAGTWLPEKLFMETYQWKILSLKDVYLLIGWYPAGVIFVIYWLLKTLLDVLHVHSKDVYSCADCGLQYWIWTYDEQWTSRAVHFTVLNERLVLKKGDICQKHLRTCNVANMRWECCNRYSMENNTRYILSIKLVFCCSNNEWN